MYFWITKKTEDVYKEVILSAKEEVYDLQICACIKHACKTALLDSSLKGKLADYRKDMIDVYADLALKGVTSGYFEEYKHIFLDEINISTDV